MSKRQSNDMPPGTERPTPPSAPPPPSSGLSRGSTGRALTKAIQEVLAERHRQIETEGWTPEHDDQHTSGELARAAACYAVSAAEHDQYKGQPRFVPGSWPWEKSWWKPTTKRRDLIKALALGLAELDRMDRSENKGNADV